MNIGLIGMPAAGKSFIGARLAEHLGLEFVELDRILENAVGLKLQKVLDELGDERFIEVEGEMLVNATSGKEGFVVSPGGSIVYSAFGMRRMKELGPVLYLKADFPMIEKRLTSESRAIVGFGTKSLRDIYDEREKLYTQYADYVIEVDEEPQTTLQRIVETVKTL